MESAEVQRATAFVVDPGAGEPGANSILSQALLVNPAVKAVRFVFSKGQELSEHTASVAAMLCQVSGRSRWVMGADVVEAVPGQWAYMPPGMAHSLLAHEDAVVLLLMLRNTGSAR